MALRYVPAGRTRSAANPLGRSGDTGIRQSEHVRYLFKITLLSGFFLSFCFFSLRPRFPYPASFHSFLFSDFEVPRSGGIHETPRRSPVNGARLAAAVPHARRSKQRDRIDFRYYGIHRLFSLVPFPNLPPVQK